FFIWRQLALARSPPVPYTTLFRSAVAAFQCLYRIDQNIHHPLTDLRRVAVNIGQLDQFSLQADARRQTRTGNIDGAADVFINLAPVLVKTAAAEITHITDNARYPLDTIPAIRQPGRCLLQNIGNLQLLISPQ